MSAAFDGLESLIIVPPFKTIALAPIVNLSSGLGIAAASAE